MAVSTKTKLLNFLTSDSTYNTLTVAQARARFNIDNVSARINELRMDGHPIYTNHKTLSDGRKISFYRYGTFSKRYKRNMRAGRTQIALATLTGKA